MPDLANNVLSVLGGVKSKSLSCIEIAEPVSVAELTLVDPLMKEHPGYLGRVCQAIGKAGVNIESISSPGITIELIVQETDLAKAAQSLAEEFQLTDQ